MSDDVKRFPEFVLVYVGAQAVCFPPEKQGQITERYAKNEGIENTNTYDGFKNSKLLE